MKFLRLTLVFGFIAFLISCFEVNEDIVIEGNGSGVYECRMDLSKFIDLIQSFAGEEELTATGLDHTVDSIISMKSILDSADETTRKRNAWMGTGKLYMKLDIPKKVYNIRMSIPYQNLGQLQSLMAEQGTLMKNSFTGLLQGNSKEDKKQDSADATFQDLVSIYKVTLTDGLFKKEVDTIRFKQLMARPEAKDIKQMAGEGMEMIYSANFKLPRPVKNSSNPLLKVSDDKRTVTLRYNLLDIVNDPAKYSFTIEY